ncbi:MAG: EMC3/TMCO1 family protein [archaeon]|nr:EMC3/TMCO1 family protein [archaeon]
MSEEGQTQQPATPDMSNMWRMMLIMILTFGLYFLDGNDHIIGKGLNTVFQFIDFKGQFPVLVLMFMGSIMILFSSGIRALMTDTLEQQKAQSFSSAFRKEFRQAKLDNNLYKVKKLTKMQPMVMQKGMESSNQMMKSMPITMLIVVPILLWIRYFVSTTAFEANTMVISVPWAMNAVNLIDIYWIFPAWILIYSLMSIPLGRIIMSVVRVFQFKKRLLKLETKADDTT